MIHLEKYKTIVEIFASNCVLYCPVQKTLRQFATLGDYDCLIACFVGWMVVAFGTASGQPEVYFIGKFRKCTFQYIWKIIIFRPV